MGSKTTTGVLICALMAITICILIVVGEWAFAIFSGLLALNLVWAVNAQDAVKREFDGYQSAALRLLEFDKDLNNLNIQDNDRQERPRLKKLKSCSTAKRCRALAFTSFILLLTGFSLLLHLRFIVFNGVSVGHLYAGFAGKMYCSTRFVSDRPLGQVKPDSFSQ